MGGIAFSLIKVRNSGWPPIKFLRVTLWHMSIYSRHIFTCIQQAAILLILGYRRLRSPISKLVTSRRFQKCCSSDVVSAFLLRKALDFTGFCGIFQDTAVAKKYFGHRFITPRKSCIARQTRFRKAQPSRLRSFLVWRKRFPERNNLSYL